MEYVEGRTLETLMQNGRIPIEAGVQYIRQTLAALEYAHEQGVVHRDVNPANLIITPQRHRYAPLCWARLGSWVYD